MATTTLTKTAAGVLLAHTQQATAVVTVGSAVDVSTKIGPAAVHVKLGRSSATALSAQVQFRLESSAKTSGNDEWVPIITWQSVTATTTASSSTVNDAAFNAGDTTFTITSATGITAGDQLYLRETGTPANSEWVRVASVSGTTITLEEAVTRNHTNGINVADQGEYFFIPIDVSGLSRIRLVVDTASNASGVTVDIIGWIVTADSASTV